MEKRARPGAIRTAVLRVLTREQRQMTVKAVYTQVLREIPHVSYDGVGQCLYELARKGTVIRGGEPRLALYSLAGPAKRGPASEKVNSMSPSDALATYTREIKAEPAQQPPVPEPPRPARVGQYTINPAGWIAADDQGGRLELFTTALEIDPTTKHPRTKKLVFETPGELRLIRAWLAQQAGGVLPAADVEAIESERDAALKLAEEAEQRAREAEEKMKAVKALFGA